MIPLYTPSQVRGMDQRAFERGIAEAALMETAAGHLARIVRRVAGGTYGRRVAILAGRGNNGGDGIAAAARLLDMGAAPILASVHDPDQLAGLPAQMLARLRRRGGVITTDVAAALRRADLAVDCLLGTGARGAPREPEAGAVAALAAFDGPVVACDTPSGVDAASGEVPAEAVRATATVTLGAHKLGLWLAPARWHAGEITVGELGIVDGADTPAAHALEPADVAATLPLPRPASHKRSRGLVTVLAGSPGMAGAAALVGWGAQALGAGLVQIATPEPARDTVAGLVPEALTVALPDDPAEAVKVFTDACAGSAALAVGPGLGTGATARALVHAAVAQLAVPLVLDADGLNNVADDTGVLARHDAPLVATPHPGELGRLTGRSSRQALAERFDLAGSHARAWEAIVVAKGPSTVVAGPEAVPWVTPTGGPELATGGTGDVLAGMVAAALAGAGADRERLSDELTRAVAAAVWLHGRGGEIAAEHAHPRTVTARDVARAVPTALRRLGDPPGVVGHTAVPSPVPSPDQDQPTP